MPPAVATDQKVPLQGIWNDGWLYRGYSTAIRLLKKNGHPRAAEFERDAAEYKQAFQKALREKTADHAHLERPDRASASPGAVRHARGDGLAAQARLSTSTPGPLFLVFAGLMERDRRPDGIDSCLVPGRASGTNVPARIRLLAGPHACTTRCQAASLATAGTSSTPGSWVTGPDTWKGCTRCLPARTPGRPIRSVRHAEE